MGVVGVKRKHLHIGVEVCLLPGDLSIIFDHGRLAMWNIDSWLNASRTVLMINTDDSGLSLSMRRVSGCQEFLITQDRRLTGFSVRSRTSSFCCGRERKQALRQHVSTFTQAQYQPREERVSRWDVLVCQES